MSERFCTPIPQSVGVEITSRCNLACRHCFNCSGLGAAQDLPLADLESLFDQLQALGLRSIRVSGGEPTLHPDFPAIVQAAARRELAVALNTNGVYSRRTREHLAALPIAIFLVSLDGLAPTNDRVRGQGVFERVVESVAWLRSLGRAVLLNIHLNRSNVADIAGLVELAARLGVDIKFAPLRPIGRARELMAGQVLAPAGFYAAVRTITGLRGAYPERRILTDFDILQEQAGGEPPVSRERACCPAGRSMVNINYDGYVYPCAFLATPDRAFAAGRLRDAPLIEIWRESPAFEAFRTIEKEPRCQSCRLYRRSCAGGCLALSYTCEGRLSARDPTCFVDYLAPAKE